MHWTRAFVHLALSLEILHTLSNSLDKYVVFVIVKIHGELPLGLQSVGITR